MILCVDLDNTLNNLQEVVINAFNNMYNASYTMNHIKTYNISECLPKEDAINMTELYYKHGLYDMVMPLTGAQNILQKIKNMGHEIYIVTHSVPSIFEEKVNWIKYYFPFIDESHIVSMQNKWMMKCDVMIEDNLDNLLGGHHYERILLDYPWNKGAHDEIYGIYRAYNWNDILNAINQIDKEWSD